jgi:hypothetical protein
MTPEDEPLEEIARRARAERSLYMAELIASGIVAAILASRAAWNRMVALVRSRPAITRQAVTARR